MGNAGMTILINPTPDELQNWYATAKVGEVCQVIAKDNKRWLMKGSEVMVQWRTEAPLASDSNGRYPKLSRYDRFEDVLQLWTDNGLGAV